MFTKAQLQLTFFYSALFLLLFWSFSFGLYFWMNNSIGEGYISQVQQRQTGNGTDSDIISKNTKVVTIAGDVALDQLRNTLIVLNAGLLFVIPLASWFLARKTLTPVAKIHEQQKQFVSDASHELRTPLSILSGEMEVTLKKNRATNEYKQIIHSNKEEVDRLTGLVENLLFLAREDQGKQQITYSSVDIIDVVSSVIAPFKKQLEDKKIHLTFHPPQESVSVTGNEGLLRQLFTNLLENAVKYTPQKGIINISFSLKKEKIIIHIKDTGEGIALEDQEKIFDRFYRVETARSQIKGYGLGLAICRAIIEQHNGKLTVHSFVGKGSAFSVELPYA